MVSGMWLQGCSSFLDRSAFLHRTTLQTLAMNLNGKILDCSHSPLVFTLLLRPRGVGIGEGGKVRAPVESVTVKFSAELLSLTLRGYGAIQPSLSADCGGMVSRVSRVSLGPLLEDCIRSSSISAWTCLADSVTSSLPKFP